MELPQRENIQIYFSDQFFFHSLLHLISVDRSSCFLCV